MPTSSRSAKRPPTRVLPDGAAASEELPTSDLQRAVIDLFVRGVRVVGLPKSIGEIYGLLYISPEALPLDTIVAKLGISKGSASQGLRFLRKLGAVQSHEIEGDRRDHFKAVAKLKPLATGFIRGELLPHLESGTADLETLGALAAADDGEDAEFNAGRIERLQTWSRRGRSLLKIVEKFVR